jgi:hypothetical protein
MTSEVWVGGGLWWGLPGGLGSFGFRFGRFFGCSTALFGGFGTNPIFGFLFCPWELRGRRGGFDGLSLLRRRAFGFDAAEFGAGFVPLAFGGLAAAEGFLEGVAVFAIGEIGSAERVWILRIVGKDGGDDGGEDLFFDAFEAAHVPIGTDDGVAEGGLFGSFGSELFVVVLREGGESFGVFAGEQDGLGINAGFQGVEAGDGFPLDGGRAGRFESVQAIGLKLCGRCHKRFNGSASTRLSSLGKNGSD